MKLFAILDVKASSYLRPFVDTSTANAIRGFDKVTNEPTSTFHAYPDDFCLMEFGEFDPQTGKFIMLDSPYNHGSARSVLRSNVEVVQ